MRGASSSRKVGFKNYHYLRQLQLAVWGVATAGGGVCVYVTDRPDWTGEASNTSGWVLTDRTDRTREHHVKQFKVTAVYSNK